MYRNSAPAKAIFLDRDGTLNVDVGYTHRISDLQLLNQVVPGLRRMAELGYLLIITTNQSGIARGYFTEAEMRDFNRALCDRLASERVAIAAIYYCPYHPTEGILPYRRESSLRKPLPGMIRQAASDHNLELRSCFAIGDQGRDVQAGRAAGCRTILLGQPDAVIKLPPGARPDFVVPDLVQAAGCIERYAKGRVPLPHLATYPLLAGQVDEFSY